MKMRVHPYFYENYKKGEWSNICPICGTEGNLTVALKIELNIYDLFRLQKKVKVYIEKKNLDLKGPTTISCGNCQMNLSYPLLKGDVHLRELETFDVNKPIKTREVIERLDLLLEDNVDN